MGHSGPMAAVDSAKWQRKFGHMADGPRLDRFSPQIKRQPFYRNEFVSPFSKRDSRLSAGRVSLGIGGDAAGIHVVEPSHLTAQFHQVLVWCFAGRIKAVLEHDAVIKGIHHAVLQIGAEGMCRVGNRQIRGLPVAESISGDHKMKTGIDAGPTRSIAAVFRFEQLDLLPQDLDILHQPRVLGVLERSSKLWHDDGR